MTSRERSTRTENTQHDDVQMDVVDDDEGTGSEVTIGDGTTVDAVRNDLIAVDKPVRTGLDNAVVNTEANTSRNE